MKNYATPIHRQASRDGLGEKPNELSRSERQRERGYENVLKVDWEQGRSHNSRCRGSGGGDVSGWLAGKSVGVCDVVCGLSVHGGVVGLVPTRGSLSPESCCRILPTSLHKHARTLHTKTTTNPTKTSSMMREKVKWDSKHEGKAHQIHPFR